MLKHTKKNLINAINRLISYYETCDSGVDTNIHGCDSCPLCKVFYSPQTVGSLSEHCSKNCPNQAFATGEGGFACCRRREQFSTLDFGGISEIENKPYLVEFWNDVNHLVWSEPNKNLFPLSDDVKNKIVKIAKTIHEKA
jgi:hypothetical protein